MSSVDIFASIPTMNDSEYLNTIEKIFDLASNPDNVNVGSTIFWKKKDLETKKMPFFWMLENKLKNSYPNVRYDILPFENFKGVGNGRTQPLKHFRGEKYYLSLDSHTHFVDNWDEKIIEAYENSRNHFGSLRLITTYLCSYVPDGCNAEKNIPETFTTNHSHKNIKKQFDVAFDIKDVISRWQYFDYDGTLARTIMKDEDYIFPVPNDRVVDPDNHILLNLIDNQYLPAKKTSAHFTFTESDPWITRYGICINPKINFWAEEFYQSVLSYARGYNFVWIKDPICFHMYGESGENKKDWKRDIKEEELPDGPSDKYEKLNFFNKYINQTFPENSSTFNENEIIKSLLKKKDYFGYLPRSPEAFLKYSKIDLYNKKCGPWWEVPKLDVIFK